MSSSITAPPTPSPAVVAFNTQIAAAIKAASPEQILDLMQAPGSMLKQIMADSNNNNHNYS